MTSQPSASWRASRSVSRVAPYWRMRGSMATPLVRAMVTLYNRGPENETALLLRYAFSARLKKIDGGSADGDWTVPFVVDERRIPLLRGHKTKPVPLQLNRVALKAYLKRMYRAGYWPDAFRVRVVVDPRAGETFSKRIREKTLPIIWKTSVTREAP